LGSSVQKSMLQLIKKGGVIMKKRKKTLKIIFIVVSISVFLYLGFCSLKYWGNDFYPLLVNCGYIDNTGKEVIPLKYARVSYFHEGLASVSNKKNLFGVIDKKGKVVIPFKYCYISDFKNGLVVAAKKRGYQGCNNSNIKYDSYLEAVLKEKSFLLIPVEYAMGVIDKTGKVVIPFKYDSIIPSDSGIFLANNYSKGEQKGVYFDRTGKKIFKSYDIMSQFTNGYASVGYRYNESIDEKGNLKITRDYSNTHLGISFNPPSDYYYTLIDTSGKEMFPFEYKRISDVYKGLAYVRKNVVKSQKDIDKYNMVHPKIAVDLKKRFYLANVTGFIDIKTNKEIVPCEFDEFSNGRCGDFLCFLPIILDKDKYIDPSITEKLIKDGCLVMEKGRESFIVKKTGEIIPLNCYFAGEYSEGLISVGRIEKDSKYEFNINMSNNKIFDTYEAALKYINNKNRVWDIKPTNVKYGYVNSDGKEVIPFIYDEANSFEDGEAYVRQGNISFRIDKTGKFLHYGKECCYIQDKKREKYVLMGDHRDSLVPVVKLTLLGRLVKEVKKIWEIFGF